MGTRKATPEKDLQICLHRLPSNLNAFGLHGGIKDLDSLWRQQGPGTIFYFFRSNFFLLIP